MNDQITELRALVGNGLRLTIVEVDALLDCAEALKPFAAIQIAEIAVPVTGDFAMDVLRARKVLARLNGDDHD